MTATLPLASFDALSLLQYSGRNGVNGLSEPEITTFAFFSCIISLAGGRSPTDWGYDFVRTSRHGVFSDALAGAVELLMSSGWLDAENQRLLMNELGRSSPSRHA